MSFILQMLRFTHENSNKLEFNQSEKRTIKFDSFCWLYKAHREDSPLTCIYFFHFHAQWLNRSFSTNQIANYGMAGQYEYHLDFGVSRLNTPSTNTLKRSNFNWRSSIEQKSRKLSIRRNVDALTRVFPRFESATCICLKMLLVHWITYVLCNWLEWSELGSLFNDTHLAVFVSSVSDWT